MMLALSALTIACGLLMADGVPRPIPRPLPHHPGNVFLESEDVIVRLPVAGATWRLVNYEERELRRIEGAGQEVRLGRLPIGFYRLRREGREEWVSLAVLARLQAPTPRTSPICVDMATAWFYPENLMVDAASLAALAGVNWVRDRLAWGHMEPERGRFVARNQYDASAEAHARMNLLNLQVNHSTPSWAGPDGSRFPPDLRDAYRFYKEMAARWKGRVAAFEPWNEADISVFGGHTGSEMAAFQKACWLGLKAGNPDVIACLNVFASHNRAQLEDLHENEAWPYFDTYNLHHYERFEAYPKLYGDHRSVSAGRPLWVTECALPVQWSGDPKLQEPTDEALREQSMRIAKVFAGSLHEGSRATFYFILGHYVEGQTQFGIIRKDLTPRPAYVALAAVGRLLADAEPLGRLQAAEGVEAYAFRAKPDGVERVVVVAWVKQGTATLDLPARPEAIFDHLGRPLPPATRLTLSSAPVYAVLPLDSAKSLQRTPPPAAPRRLTGKPSPVVLQVSFPRDRTMLWSSSYRVSGSGPTEATLSVYNFGDRPATGELRAEPPRGWRVEGLGSVALQPMEKKDLAIRLVPVQPRLRSIERLVFRGEFGWAGKPMASVRIAPDSFAHATKPGKAVAGASQAGSWSPSVSGGGPGAIANDGDWVVFQATPGEGNWFYSRIRLAAPIPPKAVALACTLELLEGEGMFRVILDEQNNAGYVADLVPQPSAGRAVATLAPISAFVHGGSWSPVDPNGRLDLPEVRSLQISVSDTKGPVRFRLRDLRWVEE